MPTRVQVLAPAAVGHSTYRFWMMASVFHLLVITLLLAGTLLLPYLIGDRPSSAGGFVSLVLVLLLLVPYMWVTALAIRTLSNMPPQGTRLVGGLPLRMLRRINIVGFGLDTALLLATAMYVAAEPIPRIAFILLTSLLVVLAFTLPPAVFVAKIHLTRMGQTVAGRLDELRRLRAELRRQHDPTRRI